MSIHSNRSYLVPWTLMIVGLPLLFWATGDVPWRTVLKETFSLLFILSFCLMLGQFFLSRGSRSLLEGLKMGSTIKIHKVIGYTFVAVLLVHPFLIVVPRYFESGVAPLEAFGTIITTFDTPGIVLGLIAWSLMLILGITSLIRNKLPMKYKTWRLLHGILSALFISLATWHAVDLGRHTDLSMSILMIALAAGGVLLLTRSWISEFSTKTGEAK